MYFKYICLLQKNLRNSWYRNVPVPKCPGTRMSPGPKCPGTEMSLVPKCPGAEISLGLKCLRAEMYLVPKCPGTEMSLGPKCPYRYVSCRKVWDRNLKQSVFDICIDYEYWLFILFKNRVGYYLGSIFL